MRVGIDVDGVLLDTRRFMLKYGQRFFRRIPVDPAGYTIEEMFGVSGSQVLLFGMRWFLPYYCRNYPPFPGAAEVYRELKNDGDMICQITARKFVLQHSPLGLYSCTALKNWLKKNHFCYDRLLLCDEKQAAQEKLIYCRQCGIDVMLEDNPVTAEVLAGNGIIVLLFDEPYNRNVISKKIIRVRNWDEAGRCLRMIRNKL